MDMLSRAFGAETSSSTPFFEEGPQYYQQAYLRNKQFAKPGPYETPLNPQEEAAFRKWVETHHVPFNPNALVTDYDMRGFWKATAGQPYAGGHFPDTFKTPYDTTFSNESIYATPDNPFVWRGNDLVDQRSGQLLFRPLK